MVSKFEKHMSLLPPKMFILPFLKHIQVLSRTVNLLDQNE
jgi:hypothetical protein